MAAVRRGRIRAIFVSGLKWYQFEECFRQCRTERGDKEYCCWLGLEIDLISWELLDLFLHSFCLEV